MEYYCYCNSNIKNSKNNPVQIEIYSDNVEDANQKINITPSKIELKNHKIFENQDRLTYFTPFSI